MFSGQVEFEPSGQNSKSQTLCQRFEYRGCDFELRSLELDDAPELFARVDTNRTRLRQWLPWLDDTQTEADASRFILRMQARAEKNQGFAVLICHAGAIAGVIDLQSINWNNRTASIGYWIDQSHEGKGLITRAAKAIVIYAFTTLELNRIEILCATQNTRSQAVPQRLGFAYEGTLRQSLCLYGDFIDHELYAMLKQDWQNRIGKQDWASLKQDYL
ncbi:MAG: GNAT family protein [Cyanobacteria bacterium P01_D01_bin.105]